MASLVYKKRKQIKIQRWKLQLLFYLSLLHNFAQPEVTAK